MDFYGWLPSNSKKIMGLSSKWWFSGRSPSADPIAGGTGGVGVQSMPGLDPGVKLFVLIFFFECQNLIHFLIIFDQFRMICSKPNFHLAPVEPTVAARFGGVPVRQEWTRRESSKRGSYRRTLLTCAARFYQPLGLVQLVFSFFVISCYLDVRLPLVAQFSGARTSFNLRKPRPVLVATVVQEDVKNAPTKHMAKRKPLQLRRAKPTCRNWSLPPFGFSRLNSQAEADAEKRLCAARQQLRAEQVPHFAVHWQRLAEMENA